MFSKAEKETVKAKETERGGEIIVSRNNCTFLTNLYRNGIIDYCDGIILRSLELGAKNGCPAWANDALGRTVETSSYSS